MAQKSNHASLNNIDRLFDAEELRKQYPSYSEETRVALLEVRTADFAALCSRQRNGGEPEPALVQVAQQLRQQLPLSDPLVEGYLPYIDGAARQGI